MSRQQKQKQPNTSLTVKEFEALTENQLRVQKNFNRYQSISCRGLPGTGKTFWLMYLAYTEILKKGSLYNRLVIVRSTVATRDMGFMPGTMAEKISPYEAPYRKHCTKLFGRADAYDLMTKHGLLTFEPTAFLRGTEFDNCIVLVDEAQNMAPNELHTINTRVGENCKLMFSGDTGQDDLTNERFKEQSGYVMMNKIHDIMSECYRVTFNEDDIVRSGYLKSYILAREAILATG